MKQIAYARKLYRQAGYSAAHPLTVTILYNSGESNKKRSLAIAAMWHEILGVTVMVQNQEWKTFLASRRMGNFAIARDGSNAEYNSVEAYIKLYICNGRLNNSHYCNPSYDHLVDLAEAATDSYQKQRYYHQALRLVLADYPIIPLYQPTYSRLVKPSVKGYQIRDNHLDRVQSKWLWLKTNIN